MQGKATIILRDKNTGKIVRQSEEHNMVTNVLERILNLPDRLRMTANTSSYYTRMFPMTTYLASGLVMFDEALKEDPDNFMVPPGLVGVGAAGSAYTGTNPKRGTLNISQSGPIDNGYRFVWDFAPEKAVGTIKCIGLTHYLYGNMAFSQEYATDCGFTTLPISMDASSNSTTAMMINLQGAFYGKTSGNYIYSLTYSGTTLNLFKYRLPDISAIKINDTYTSFTNPTLDSQFSVTLPFNVQVGGYHFYDPDEDVLYFSTGSVNNPLTRYAYQYVGIKPETGAVVKSGVVEVPTNVSVNFQFFACYKNRIYISVQISGVTYIHVFNSSGALLDKIAVTGNNNEAFAIDGKLMGTRIISNISYKYYMDYPDIICGYSDNLRHHKLYGVPMPYCIKATAQGVTYTITLVLRCDYLATINNLSSPIEKTDQHALQIRYEITNN